MKYYTLVDGSQLRLEGSLINEILTLLKDSRGPRGILYIQQGLSSLVTQ